MPFDCSDGGCSFADFDADGLTDILRLGPNTRRLEVWRSSDTFERAVPLVEGATCGEGERCLWADVNADRFTDIVRIDPEGTVSSTRASTLAGGSRRRRSLALSTLETRQAAALRADADAARVGLLADSPDSPSSTALLAASFTSQRSDLAGRVDAAITEVLGAIPADAAVTTEATIRRTSVRHIRS